MDTTELHAAQASILRSLRHSPTARYSMLMRPTGMDSDVFKFHVRKLVHQKYVRKLEDGSYELTPAGKEFANNLDRHKKRSVQKQPKLSVAVVAYRQVDDEIEYLFQQRLRSPFYGFWGCISGPVQWGESFEAAAQREFEKQTGLSAYFTVHAYFRKTDYSKETNELLEDKLFVVVEATDVTGNATNTWSHGLNAWMPAAKLKQHEQYFASTFEFIGMLETGQNYAAKKYFYSSTEY